MKLKFFLLFIVFASILAIGCERQVETGGPIRPLPTDGPVPTDIIAQLIDGAVILSWQVDDTAGIARYRVFTAPVSDTSHFTLRDSTTGTSIIIRDLPVNLRYYFSVAAVSGSGFQWDRSHPVTSRVMHLSISVNGGNDYTSSRDVLVWVNVPSGIVTHTQLSESPILADAHYLPIQGTQMPFTLSDADGPKTVYAKLQFDDGTTTGDPMSASITLDRQANIDSVFFNSPGSDGKFEDGETIRFGLNSKEAGGSATVTFTGGGNIQLYDDATHSDNVANDGIYYGQWVVPINFTLNNGAVTGSFTDQAGNRPPQKIAPRALNVFTLPPAVSLWTSIQSSSEIGLNWTRSVSTDFASYRIYRSTTSTVNLSSTLVTTINGEGSTNYVDEGLNGGTTYYYRVYVFNNSGSNAGSTVVSVTTPPTATP